MINFETDVLVIGGGGGGAVAAYEASKHGASILMVLKGRPQRCGSTIMAPGAIAGVGDWRVPGDTQDIHFSDTVKGGAFLGEQGLIRTMVKESPDLIIELERIGALWEREEDGKTYALRAGGGHSFLRSTFLEDRTGREMLRSLMGELQKRNIKVLSEVMILRLLKPTDRIAGAVGLDLGTGEAVLLRAKTVILACGGAGNLYLNTDNPIDVTGDGYGLALELGADLMDMEFIQFFPLGFCFPHSLRGALAGLPYYVHLLNNLGERFMDKYDSERLELSTRDKVSRAIYTEIKEGRGSPHGGVYADMTYHEPGFISRMQPALYETYRKIGIDPEKDYLEVAPTCHFFMGGARVNENWESTIPGLFVVGENAAGIHGANRLSQNALAELLVSGTHAGRAAALLAADIGQAPIDPLEAKTGIEPIRRMFARDSGLRPMTVRNRLRQIMWEKVGLYRTESSLIDALRGLETIKDDLDKQALSLMSKHYNRELVEAIENHFLFSLAMCVTQAALQRKESRGAHYREDYPVTDNQNWLKHLVIYQMDNELNLKTIPVDLREMSPAEEKC
jgi:succinate dehydrogenase/fumarate reductase flavoprotein subunit